MKAILAASLWCVSLYAQDDPAASERSRVAALREQGDQALSRAMQDGRGLTSRAVELRIAALRYDDAARWLQRAIDRDPPKAETLFAWGRAILDRRIETRVLLARAFVARGSLRDAARMLEEARVLKPKDARIADLAALLKQAKKGAASEDGSTHLGHVAGESPFGAPPRPTDHPVWDNQREGRQPPAPPSGPPQRETTAPPPFPGRR